MATPQGPTGGIPGGPPTAQSISNSAFNPPMFSGPSPGFQFGGGQMQMPNGPRYGSIASQPGAAGPKPNQGSGIMPAQTSGVQALTNQMPGPAQLAQSNSFQDRLNQLGIGGPPTLIQRSLLSDGGANGPSQYQSTGPFTGTPYSPITQMQQIRANGGLPELNRSPVQTPVLSPNPAANPANNPQQKPNQGSGLQAM